MWMAGHPHPFRYALFFIQKSEGTVLSLKPKKAIKQRMNFCSHITNESKKTNQGRLAWKRLSRNEVCLRQMKCVKPHEVCLRHMKYWLRQYGGRHIRTCSAALYFLYGYEESNLLGFCRLFFINISLKSLAMRQHSFVFCLIWIKNRLTKTAKHLSLWFFCDNCFVFEAAWLTPSNEKTEELAEKSKREAVRVQLSSA